MKCNVCGEEFETGRFCPECGHEVVTKEMIHQEKIEVARKYADEITERSAGYFYVNGEIPSQKLNNAIAAYAPNIVKNTIVGMYDSSIMENGKEGTIVTDNEIYHKDVTVPYMKVPFSDVDHFSGPYIYYKDNHNIYLDYDAGLRVSDLLNELLEIDKKYGINRIKAPKHKKEKLTKYEVVEKYGPDIMPGTDFFIRGVIPAKRLKNAISKYASGAANEEVLGLFDTTVMDSGKAGMVLTDKALYQNVEEDLVNVFRYKDFIGAENRDHKYIFTYWRGSDIYENKVDQYGYEIKYDKMVKFIEAMKDAVD